MAFKIKREVPVPCMTRALVSVEAARHHMINARESFDVMTSCRDFEKQKLHLNRNKVRTLKMCTCIADQFYHF